MDLRCHFKTAKKQQKMGEMAKTAKNGFQLHLY